MRLLVLILSVYPFLSGMTNGNSNRQIYMAKVTCSDFASSEHTCGGCVIDKKHVLTAAHCVTYPKNGKYEKCSTIFVEIDGSEPEQYMALPYIHDKYQYETVHEGTVYDGHFDLAILKLLGQTDHIRNFVKLPSKDITHKSNLFKKIFCPRKAFISLWNMHKESHKKTNHANSNENGIININFDIMDQEKCPIQPKQLITNGRFVNEQFCATAQNYGRALEGGHSGSPLISGNEIVGILSAGFDEPNKPEYFTHIFYYKEFINSVLERA